MNRIRKFEGKRLDGKTAIVTGASIGIGEQTAHALASRGCNVIMTSRNFSRLNEAINRIMREENNGRNKKYPKGSNQDYLEMKMDQFIPVTLDLASIESILEFTEQVKKLSKPIDFLICNAGIMACEYGLTEEGFEMQMGVNHLGHVVLVESLLNQMTTSKETRIIILSSVLHYYGEITKESISLEQSKYNAYKAYCNSKLANMVYTKWLSLQAIKIPVLCVHPGVVNTELIRHFSSSFKTFYRTVGRWFMKSPWEGCLTTVYCVLTDDPANGGYYEDCRLKSPLAITNNVEFVENVMQYTYELLLNSDKRQNLISILNKFPK